MINLVLCDDNELHLKKMQALAEDALSQEGIPFATRLFLSAKALLQAVTAEELRPDIAVLDIEMDRGNGISLAQELNALVPRCRIIFATSYADYASDVYNVEHVWFVVKNRAEEYFRPAIKKALDSLNEQETSDSGLLLREKGRVVFIPLSKILYVGKEDRKALVHCLDGDHYDTRSPAKLIPEALQDQFVHCHQGYWVRLSMISELDREEFILKNGERIPISRSYRQEARKRFFDTYSFPQ